MKIRNKIILIIFCLGIFGAGYYFMFSKIEEGVALANVVSLKTVAPATKNAVVKYQTGIPIRLKIPSIKIDAFVESVGLTDNGAVGVPTKPETVAWFNLSPLPGEIGSSIIDGHSGYKNNKIGVFDNLYKLKKGDKIYVQDEKGATTIFIVREIKKYNRNAILPNVFISSDGKAHLNLITCAGDWDRTGKTHFERLIVFTDKI